jgi:hypothetical protein
MPVEKQDPGGNADILAFKEIVKKGDFSSLGQTESMIIFIELASETAALPRVAMLRRSSKWGP